MTRSEARLILLRAIVKALLDLINDRDPNEVWSELSKEVSKSQEPASMGGRSDIMRAGLSRK